MKRKILMTSLICIATLASCADVPDEVKQDMSAYREESRVDYVEKEDDSFTYIKVSELAKNAESALKKDYKQFKISDKINFRQPDELHIMSFKKHDDVDDFYGIMGMFFDEETLRSHTVEVDEEDGKQKIWDENDKMYAIIERSGFVAALTPDGFDRSYGEEGEVLGIYHADRLDDLSDTYPLADRDCSIAEAVEFVNKFLDDKFSKFFPEFDYETETVIVRKPDDKCYFEIEAHCIYKGVPLDSYTRQYNTPGETVKRKEYTDTLMSFRMIKSDEICLFTNGGVSVVPTEIETVEECISLESVLDFCANEFADFKEVELSEIGLMYTLHPVYGESKDNPDGTVYRELIRYDSRPVWEIIMDIPRNQLPKDEYCPLGDMRKTIYIDAVTGEMDYCFDPPSRI